MINAHSLQDRPVVSTSGRRLGHLHDLRCVLRGGAGVVTHLVYGRRGLLENLGFRGERYDTIPWAQVREIRADAIIVDDQP
jgi:sporulation protein YlmC with PRC-barrel domain